MKAFIEKVFKSKKLKKEVKVGFWKRLFSNIGSKSSIKR
jgi:hypothetical protein